MRLAPSYRACLSKDCRRSCRSAPENVPIAGKVVGVPFGKLFITDTFEVEGVLRYVKLPRPRTPPVRQLELPTKCKRRRTLKPCRIAQPHTDHSTQQTERTQSKNHQSAQTKQNPHTRREITQGRSNQPASAACASVPPWVPHTLVPWVPHTLVELRTAAGDTPQPRNSCSSASVSGDVGVGGGKPRAWHSARLVE